MINDDAFTTQRGVRNERGDLNNVPVGCSRSHKEASFFRSSWAQLWPAIFLALESMIASFMTKINFQRWVSGNMGHRLSPRCFCEHACGSEHTSQSTSGTNTRRALLARTLLPYPTQFRGHDGSRSVASRVHARHMNVITPHHQTRGHDVAAA